MIIITEVEDDKKQVVSLREALMNKDHREGPAKEFIKIHLAQFVAEDLIHECKVIFVDLKLSVEDSLIGNLAGLVV